MKKHVSSFSLLAFVLFSSGCFDEKATKHFDAKNLLESKCSKCHNLDLPPKLLKKELAPPMMAISHHVFNKVSAKNESERMLNAIAFVKDYVLNPSVSKSFCDKDSLKKYGVMPSQKGNVDEDELEAIASYIFKHFTQKNLTEILEAKERLNAMSKGERLALKNNCLGCHRVDKKLVGPSFKDISAKYHNNIDKITYSIINGSSKKWTTRGVMPSFKSLSKADVEVLSKWILEK